MADGQSLPTLLGKPLPPVWRLVSGPAPLAGGSPQAQGQGLASWAVISLGGAGIQPQESELLAANGVVHVIDRVLLPGAAQSPPPPLHPSQPRPEEAASGHLRGPASAPGPLAARPPPAPLPVEENTSLAAAETAAGAGSAATEAARTMSSGATVRSLKLVSNSLDLNSRALKLRLSLKFSAGIERGLSS